MNLLFPRKKQRRYGPGSSSETRFSRDLDPAHQSAALDRMVTHDINIGRQIGNAQRRRLRWQLERPYFQGHRTPCSYDPRPLVGQPIGMFHCPECGEMVIAGMAHPDYESALP